MEDTLRIHFIGVAGIGMRGLARICLQKGWKVSGSDDRASSAVLQPLVKAGMKILPEDFDLANENPDWVVYSSAIALDHPQRSWASATGRLQHRSQLLASFFNQAEHRVAVTGSHGKTTVSSWLSHVLHLRSGASYCVGGLVRSLGQTASMAEPREWVIEADESDGSLDIYEPTCLVITNINDDHLNHWKTLDALESFMMKYAQRALSPVICQDDPRMAKWPIRGLRYGFASESDLRITHWESTDTGLNVQLSYRGDDLGIFKSQLVGKHNAQNLTAVVAACLCLGLQPCEIKPLLASFEGAGRRLEFVGQVEDIRYFDDYAVHPREIETTIEALRSLLKTNEELRVIFQPHRSTRLSSLMKDIAKSLRGADELWICPLYLAGEEPIDGVDSPALADQISKLWPEKRLVLFDSLKDVQEALKYSLQKKQTGICATMGAGNVTSLAREWVLTQYNASV